MTNLPPTAEALRARVRNIDSELQRLDGHFVRALYINAEDASILLAALSPEGAGLAGEVVVTKNTEGEIVSVTRQDDEGRVLEVIAQSTPKA